MKDMKGKNKERMPIKLTNSKNPTNLKYSRTKKGTITNIYAGMRRRARDYNRVIMPKIDFYRWIEDEQATFSSLFRNWEESAYTKELKPSVDRINNKEGYSINNIRLCTWRENRIAAIESVSKKVVQLKDDKIINTYSSGKEAERRTKIHSSHISRVARGSRKTAGGFKWKYI